MVTMKRARPITAVLIGLLGALAALSCGGSSRGENTHPGTAGTGAAGLAASGGEAGSAASGRGGGGSGRGGAAGSIGGTGGSSGSAAGAGATSAAGGTAPLAGRDGSGGTSAGQSAGGSSGESSSGDGGSAGERAIECTGAMPYFPEFDRTCTTDDDCVTVAHQTSCCGSELLMGIRSPGRRHRGRNPGPFLIARSGPRVLRCGQLQSALLGNELLLRHAPVHRAAILRAELGRPSRDTHVLHVQPKRVHRLQLHHHERLHL
jgi:hypothetical protein